MNLREYNYTTKQIVSVLLIISLIATCGSLYLSLGLGLVPCKFCWYQRILMYPLVLISLVGLYESKYYENIYFVFSLLGVLIAGYHSFIQFLPAGSETFCTTGCTAVLYKVSIFTIPNLSLIAFTLIFSTVIFTKSICNKND